MQSISAKLTPPVIIIGMHRSGTSLLAKLLMDYGLFIGKDRRGGHDESQFFLTINKAIFSLANTGWDNPKPVHWLSDDTKLNGEIQELILDAINSNKFDEYQFGEANQNGENTSFPEHWGWKDPRSTFTLDYWLQLFPNAKVINIVRNGVDVANSLLTRESKRLGRVDSKARSSRCLNMQRSFDLWTEYVTQAKHLCDSYGPKQCRTIRYEDLISNPDENLAMLVNFIGLQRTTAPTAIELDPKRQYSFLKNDRLTTFYATVQHSKLMKQYGYNDLTSNFLTKKISITPIDQSPSKATFDVIIPTNANGSDQSLTWLDQAIQSVRDQTFSDWHLYLVIDNPTQRPNSYLEKIENELSNKVTIIDNFVSCGPSRSRMKALMQSGSPYVCFLDHDDLWRSDKLEEQILLFKKNDQIDLIHTNIEIINDKGIVIQNASLKENNKRDGTLYSEMSREDLCKFIFSYNTIRIISTAFKRTSLLEIDGYDTTLNGGEDWELLVRFANRFKIAHIKKPLMLRRHHSNNTSTTNLQTRMLGQHQALGKMTKSIPYLMPLYENRLLTIKRSLSRLNPALADTLS